jgi:hypothetical protein
LEQQDMPAVMWARPGVRRSLRSPAMRLLPPAGVVFVLETRPAPQRASLRTGMWWTPRWRAVSVRSPRCTRPAPPGTVPPMILAIQADCLRALFVGMNDESCTVRGLAIRLVGRLADRNPAHVNPALRKHLLQLLHDLEFSPDNRAREGESAKASERVGEPRGLL